MLRPSDSTTEDARHSRPFLRLDAAAELTADLIVFTTLFESTAKSRMARLPFVQDDAAPEDVRAAFEAANRFNGRVANSMRMFAHSPAIVKFLLPLQAVLQKDGLGCKLDARTRALAMIKVSALNECRY